MSANADEVDAGVPEVKVPAAVNAGGMVRFELSREQLEQIHDQLQDEYDEASEDDFVPLRFMMDRATYEGMVEGLTELQSRLPSVGVKQVPLDVDPEYALTVVINQEQISNTITTAREALENAGEEDTYSQEYRLSRKGAILVIRQLEEALDGAAEPIEAIDIDQIRENYS